MILVCGGAGYIGSHMVRLLLKRGYHPLVLDNFSTGHLWAVERAFQGFGQPNVIRGDQGDQALLADLFQKYDFAAVMHFAARSLVGESVVQPADYYANNVAGTLNLLRAMVRARVNRFIFSSTCAIYGQPKTMPLSEDLSPAPITPYGRSKLMCELMMADFAAAYGLKAVALRYFNAAGADPSAGLGEAHDPETHLLPNVIKSALGQGPPLNIFGRDYPTPDGTCLRDYIHVYDLAEAHLRALEYLKERPAGHFDYFNLGLGRGVSNLEITQSVERVSGRRVAYEFAPRRDGDPPELYADAAKAERLLNWKPRVVELDQIVNSAWLWHTLPGQG